MQELTILESRGSVTTDGGFGSFGGFRVVSSVSSSSSSMPTSSGDGDLFGVVCLLVMLYVFRKTGNDGKVEPENEIFISIYHLKFCHQFLKQAQPFASKSLI